MFVCYIHLLVVAVVVWLSSTDSSALALVISPVTQNYESPVVQITSPKLITWSPGWWKNIFCCSAGRACCWHHVHLATVWFRADCDFDSGLILVWGLLGAKGKSPGCPGQEITETTNSYMLRKFCWDITNGWSLHYKPILLGSQPCPANSSTNLGFHPWMGWKHSEQPVVWWPQAPDSTISSRWLKRILPRCWKLRRSRFLHVHLVFDKLKRRPAANESAANESAWKVNFLLKKNI